MNMGDRVILPGYLPSEHLGQVMAHCSAMIFPSLYEGFGLPVLEAMNAGIPVACSNLTSLPEVAKDAALLFDPRVPEEIAQAMVSLTIDQDLRLRLIEAGRTRALEFANSVQMADEYWNLFEYAVAHPKHSVRRVAERTST
jgi:glycosyltransferase involved in cell wall biosynthesis